MRIRVLLHLRRGLQCHSETREYGAREELYLLRIIDGVCLRGYHLWEGATSGSFYYNLVSIDHEYMEHDANMSLRHIHLLRNYWSW